MKIHLVAIDLDGTLLNSAKRITDTTAAILQDVRRTAGVKIVLASARPPRTVMPFYRLLDLEAPMINYNGALVCDPPSGRILMHRPIVTEAAKAIVELARRVFPEVVVSAEILDRWYTDRLDPTYLTETARLMGPDVVAPIGEWLNTDVTKLMFLGDPGRLGDVAAAIRREFLHQVGIVQTEQDLLQVTHATVSKAQALRVVAGELGVMRERTMAIGDNANDVGMLQWAGVSVAMGNASAEAKAVADVIADDHDADGAAKAIHNVIVRGVRPKKKGRDRE